MPKRTKKTYEELIAEFPLRPIKNERMNDRAGKIAGDLALHAEALSRGELDYLDVLTTLIEIYEAEHHAIDTSDLTPVDFLRHLIEENGLTLSRLADETGIKVSTLSLILSGKRKMNVRHMNELAKRFGVNTSLFHEKPLARSAAS